MFAISNDDDVKTKNCQGIISQPLTHSLLFSLDINNHLTLDMIFSIIICQYI
jgi:hypothetical protein